MLLAARANSKRYMEFPNGYTPTFEVDYMPGLLKKRDKGFLKGLYFHWLSRWFKLFDRKRILILHYDEIKERPESAMKRVHAFLNTTEINTEKVKVVGITPKGVIAASAKVASCATQEKMRSWFYNDTNLFYKLLEENPGPPMEQRPFPKFKYSCYKNPGSFSNATLEPQLP